MSVLSVKKYDKDYSRAVDKVTELEAQCGAMGLTPEQNVILEKLREALDEEEIEQSVLSYLAGFADGVMILDALELLKE
ncbi:MAG: hypothetical protein HFG70_07685 [Hungatella sp.]|nr:hypothetical protein [Hungatella sp.]